MLSMACSPMARAEASALETSGSFTSRTVFGVSAIRSRYETVPVTLPVAGTVYFTDAVAWGVGTVGWARVGAGMLLRQARAANITRHTMAAPINLENISIAPSGLNLNCLSPSPPPNHPFTGRIGLRGKALVKLSINPAILAKFLTQSNCGKPNRLARIAACWNY